MRHMHAYPHLVIGHLWKSVDFRFIARRLSPQNRLESHTMCIDQGWEFPRFLNEASQAQWQFVVPILCNLNPQGEVCHSLTLFTCKPIRTVIDSYTSWVNDLSSFGPSVDLNRFPQNGLRCSCTQSFLSKFCIEMISLCFCFKMFLYELRM